MSKPAVMRSILSDTLDPLHKLAYADILDEEGATALAHAYRWMAARDRHPHRRTHYRTGHPWRKVPEQYGWAWWPTWAPSHVCSREVIRDANKLPRLVFLACGAGRGREHLFFGSFEEAVDALAFGLEKMRQDYEVKR